MLKLVGYLLGEKLVRWVWTIWDKYHLGLFRRFHQGTVLSCEKLWWPVHQMDHSASREGPTSFGIHQQISYLAHKDGYQKLQVAPDTEISQWSTLVHPKWHALPWNLFTWIFLSLCYQNQRGISTKKQATLCTYKPTVESRKGKTCPTKHKTRKWQPVLATRKEGEWKEKEVHQEVVQIS